MEYVYVYYITPGVWSMSHRSMTYLNPLLPYTQSNWPDNIPNTNYSYKYSEFRSSDYCCFKSTHVDSRPRDLELQIKGNSIVKKLLTESLSPAQSVKNRAD